MHTLKQKHLNLEDRLTIQDYLDSNASASTISKRLNKDRTSISREVYNHRFIKTTSNYECDKLKRFPFVCNGCDLKKNCHKRQYRYDASIAQNEYRQTLIKTRSYIKIDKEDIANINEKILLITIVNCDSNSSWQKNMMNNLNLST